MTVCVWSLLGYTCIVVLTVLSYFAIILLRKRELAALHKLNCCLLSVLLSSICYCSVSVPNGVMGWSVVFDCGISMSYSLTFCYCFLL